MSTRKWKDNNNSIKILIKFFLHWTSQISQKVFKRYKILTQNKNLSLFVDTWTNFNYQDEIEAGFSTLALVA